MRCPPCGGRGANLVNPELPCHLCFGTGELPDQRINQPMCPACRGRGALGNISDKLCEKCGGWGRLSPEDVPSKLIPELQRKEIDKVVRESGWGENWFLWKYERSKFGNYLVSKLVFTDHPDFFFKFDFNVHGTRISEYAPGESDTAPTSSYSNETWSQRLANAQRWAKRLADLRKPDSDKGEVPPDSPFVVYIEAGKPRSAHRQLTEMFSELQGELRICDPYYGLGSLLRLDHLTHCQTIKFLTQKPDSGEKETLPRAVREFMKEHTGVEIRLHAGKDLHDRFVLSNSELIVLGHGLKDVGNRQSFVIRLPRQFVGDVLDSVQATFDAQWSAATPVVA